MFTLDLKLIRQILLRSLFTDIERTHIRSYTLHQIVI